VSDLIYGGDPCPRCRITLGYDEDGGEREPRLIHPDPQCGWRPRRYPERAVRPAIDGKVVDRLHPPLFIHTGIPWTPEEMKRRGLPLAGPARLVIGGAVEEPGC
jgi:hypothetical protein